MREEMIWGANATVSTPPASSLASTLIRDAIIDGRLKPGQRLKEEELARQFGISRTPIREALLILQTEGAVVAARNRGVMVRSYDASELEDLYDLRGVLEGYAVARAATRITADELKQLEENTRLFRAAKVDKNLPEVMSLNANFHNLILLAARSERLQEALRTAVQLPLVYQAFAWYSDTEKAVSDHYHGRIVAALAAGDAQRAELIMREHVFEARDLLVARVRARELEAEQRGGDAPVLVAPITDPA